MKKRAKKRSKTYRSKSGNVYKLTLVKKGTGGGASLL